MPKLATKLISRYAKSLFVAGVMAAFWAPPIGAATTYTYDELNRVTKVVYDDGRSISYAYDAAGNLLRTEKNASAVEASVQLEDHFNGTALNTDVWTSRGGNSCGGIAVSGGFAKFNGGTSADTVGKKAFAGNKIVVQAIMAGTGSDRDTHFELVDTASGDRLQFGDTNYESHGLFFYGTGRYNLTQRSYGFASTSAFKAYRLTVEGSRVTFERGDTPNGAMAGASINLPASTIGRSFYLRIGTGASDCYYSPGTFDWIKVNADPLISAELSDDFNATQLDASKWLSAGYEYEPDIAVKPAGSFTLQGGVLELGNAGGLATLGKHHFKARKIVVEARIARTGSGEFPVMLVSPAELRDRILFSETPYCSIGFFGAGGGIFEFIQKTVVCGNSAGHVALGSPAPVGVWMEYRMTVEGDKFTMERGPTLQNITQSTTATLGKSIDGREFFLYFRTGSAGNFFGAKFDWVRVRASP